MVVEAISQLKEHVWGGAHILLPVLHLMGLGGGSDLTVGRPVSSVYLPHRKSLLPCVSHGFQVILEVKVESGIWS